MPDGFVTRRQGDPNGKKKTLAIAAVASVLLIAMVIAVAIGFSGTGEESHKSKLSTTNKAVESICQPTDYKKTCEQSLENKIAGSSTTDPKKLVQTGFEVAIDALHVAIKNSTALQEIESDPKAKLAFQTCQELMNDSIEDLQFCINQIEEFDVRKIDEYLDDLKTWLSASLTYQETCLDGFENITSKSGEKMKENLSLSNQLSSNGLAMVSELSKSLKDLDISGVSGRRLLDNNNNNNNNGDGFPSWLGPQQRKLLATPAAAIKANIVVAQDGTGQYKTIDEAIHKIPKNQNTTFVVHIKAGVYEENIKFPRSLTHIMLIGDGPTKTKIIANHSFADAVPTYQTATVSINGPCFMAKDIGFENSAGAKGHQAVALKVQADRSVFYNCRMDGFQATLFAHTNRQFYRDCTITGTIDFIFGNAAAVFQNCKIIVRKPLKTQDCIVIAQGKNESRQVTGFVLQNCSFTADKEDPFDNPTYLGRPWKGFSTTIIMQSEIDDLIDPAGWKSGYGNFGTETGTFAEYENRGAGADTKKRVTWKCIKKLTAKDVVGYTASKFIEGDIWIPTTGVPYAAGMMDL